MTITSRPPLDTSQKISTANSTKYKPLGLSDESVYHFAQHYYTAEEIAERFNISRRTLLDLHGDAFNKGKDEAKNLPRFALQKVIKDFMRDPDQNLAQLPNTAVLLKAIEIHARKYEGYGQTQTINHVGGPAYDGVETAPIIIERPEV